MRRRELTSKEKEIISTTQKVDDEFVINEFIKSRRIRNVRESTIKYYYDAFHVLKRDLKELSINKALIELSEEDVESVISLWQRKLKVTSINSKLRGIRPFYKFVFEKKWIKSDPTENIQLLRDREQIRETLEKFEVKLISNYFRQKQTFANYRDLVIFQLLLDTGIRINECMNIQLDDITGKQLIITETKNLHQRIVYLSKGMQRSIQSYLKVRGDLEHNYIFINQYNGRLSISTFQERLKTAARACKIKKQVSPHVLRRTYSKSAVLAGIDPFSLASLLGHSSIDVTKRYVQIYGQDLEAQSLKKESYEDIF